MVKLPLEREFSNVAEPSRLSKIRQDACPTKIGCYEILIPW